MPISIYVDALREFNASLDDLEAYVDFIRASDHLRPRVRPMIDYANLNGEQRLALEAFANADDYHHELGFSGLVVTLAGIVENLLRRLVRDGVLWINGHYDKFEVLAESLRNRNIQQSGYALSTVFDPPLEITYSYEQMCRNLGTCAPGGGALVLNADAFTANLTNMTPNRIDEALKRIGVAIDWDVFGRNAAIQNLLGETRVRDAQKATKEWLSQFIANRNRLAHSSTGGPYTSENTLRTAIEFFAAFGPTLAQAVEDVLKRNHRKR